MHRRAHDSFQYYSIYDEACVLRDLETPIAYIFGGESGPPMMELFQKCDVGGFIPSCSRSGTENLAASSQAHPVTDADGCASEAGQAPARQLRDDDSTVEHSRMHSCNLSIAACIVLAERHRLLLARRKPECPRSLP